MAAAGVDASNTPAGTVLLLPEDPDASARTLREGLRDTLGVDVGVIVTDTFGRPWRTGLTDVAVGAAGVRVLDDLRGARTRTAIRSARPSSPPRTNWPPPAIWSRARPPGCRSPSCAAFPMWWPTTTARAPARWCASRATTCSGWAPPRRSGRRDPAADGADLHRRTGRPGAVRRAVAAAVTAPAPHHTTPWRFVLLESQESRTRLLDAMRDAWIPTCGGTEDRGVDRQADPARDVLRNAPCLVVPAW